MKDKTIAWIVTIVLTILGVGLLGLVTTGHIVYYKVVEYNREMYKQMKAENEMQSKRNKAIIESPAVQAALVAFKKYRTHRKLKHFRYIGVVDYTKHSKYNRFYVIDRIRKTVLYKNDVAHGIGSVGKSKGVSRYFSNKVGSKMSSVGSAVTGSIYYGRHGRSMNLHGLSPSNSLMFVRRIVIHGANYANLGYKKKYGRLGTSWGCLAVDTSVKDRVMNALPKGSFIYMYGG